MLEDQTIFRLCREQRVTLYDPPNLSFSKIFQSKKLFINENLDLITPPASSRARSRIVDEHNT